MDKNKADCAGVSGQKFYDQLEALDPKLSKQDQEAVPYTVSAEARLIPNGSIRSIIVPFEKDSSLDGVPFSSGRDRKPIPPQQGP